MLTPKMSVRRKNVVAAYETLIENAYAGTAGFPLKHNHHSKDVNLEEK